VIILSQAVIKFPLIVYLPLYLFSCLYCWD